MRGRGLRGHGLRGRGLLSRGLRGRGLLGRGFLLLALAALAGAALPSSCGRAREPERRFGAQALVIYSSQSEELLRFLTDEYRDRTAFPITLLRGDAPSLLARLEEEREAPQADLFWGRPGEAAEGGSLLLPYAPPGLSAEATRPLLGDLAYVRGGPNAGAARAFANFLSSAETARALAARFGE